MSFLSLFLSLHLIQLSPSPEELRIITSDIDHFWEAYDQLEQCASRADSIRAFQLLYFNHRLLMQSIHEGSADFLAEKVAGATINQHLHRYGDEQEQEIWNAFRKDMYRNDFSNWLYQGNSMEGEAPADLGYYVGYKICESYYVEGKDKKSALREMVKIGNHKRFLKRSKYAEKMGRR